MKSIPARLLLPALLSIAAGCAEAPPERPKVLRAESGFADLAQTVVSVRVTEIPSGAALGPILLRDPEGRVFAATELATRTRQIGRRLTTGPVSAAVGVNVRPRSGAIRSGGPAIESRQISAEIPLPDPAAYRAAPEGWRIEVHYSDVTGAARVLEMAAPRPVS